MASSEKKKKSSLIIESTETGPLMVNCIILKDPDAKIAYVVDIGGHVNNVLKKVEGYQVEKIIATHAHIDHIGGMKELKDKTGGDIYCHKADEFLWNLYPQQCRMLGLPFDKDSVCPIDCFMEHDDEFILADTTIQVLHTPGHSPGSVCLYIKELNTLLSGDTIFAMGGQGRTDLWGGSDEKIYNSIMKLLRLPAETIIRPGHGPESSVRREQMMHH